MNIVFSVKIKIVMHSHSVNHIAITASIFKDYHIIQPSTKKDTLLVQINHLNHTQTRAFLPELLPEAPGDVVLQPRSSQVAKDDLQVAQHTDVVLLPVLRLAGRLVIELVVVAEHLVPRVHVTLW